MKKVNIISVIEPKKRKYGYDQYALWHVEIQDPETKTVYFADKTEHEYNAFVLEQEFLAAGVDPKKLEAYRSEVYDLGVDAGWESGMSEAGVDLG